MKPDVAFYYPSQYWPDQDWVKNLILYLERLTKPLLEQKARADDGTTYGQESLMYVCPALISNP